jgi:hypothetical protein
MSKNGMNAGMIGVAGRYYQSTHESLRSACFVQNLLDESAVSYIDNYRLLTVSPVV